MPVEETAEERFVEGVDQALLTLRHWRRGRLPRENDYMHWAERWMEAAYVERLDAGSGYWQHP